MKKRLIIYLCVAQLLFISTLLISIFYKNKKNVSVQKVMGSSVEASHSGELHFFFEPKAGEVIKDDLSWMGKGYNYTVEYSINSDTLNQVSEVSIEKSKSNFRIITLGTSYTFGSFVNTQENYSSLLHNLLSKNCNKITKFDVINLGVAGYDISYSVERFRKRGLKYKPDLVVWFLTDPDFQRFTDLLLPQVKTILDKNKITNKNQQLLNDNGYYPYWREANSRVLRLLGGKPNALRKQGENISRLFQDYEGIVIFVGQGLRRENISLLQQIVNENKSAYLYNNVSSFYETENELPDHHPNSRGHEIIASEIKDYLTENNFIPCK